MKNNEDWKDAMKCARNELGYYPNEYVEDWDGLIEKTRAIFAFFKQERYVDFCVDAWNKYRDYLKSDKWKSLRRKVLLKDKYTCQDCNSSATEVHHLNYNYLHTKKEIEFCISLCKKCHRKRHFNAKAKNNKGDDKNV